MRSNPFINDASLATAAVLGALSFAAMLSLGHGLPEKQELLEAEKDSTECSSGNCPSGRGVEARDIRKDEALYDLQPPVLVEEVKAADVQKFDGPMHVISVDKDGNIVCGHAKPHPIKDAPEAIVVGRDQKGLAKIAMEQQKRLQAERERADKTVKPEKKPEEEVSEPLLAFPIDLCKQDPRKAQLVKEGKAVWVMPNRGEKSVDGADYQKPHPPIHHDEALLVQELSMPIPPPVNAAFDANLYQLFAAKEENVFFSPYSITEAMAMVYAGTGGNTTTEIGKALSFQQDAKGTSNHLLIMRNHLGRSLNKGDNKLSIANALCVTGIAPKQAYQDMVRQQFGGELFSGGLPEINGWVKKKTEGKIEKILDRLSADSACVLLNAVYFKGNWQIPFKSHSTHKAPFHVSGGEKARVDMMMRNAHYRLVQDMGLIAVELPYQTGASMVLIMPEKADGMKALEKQLSSVMLDQVCNKLASAQPQDIDLYLPKFKLETEYDLIPAMRRLGMSDAFEGGKANFEAMYDRSDISIAQIKHKAALEVDEKGSVAAAVTAVELKAESATIHQPLRIRFDRPFITIIRDRDSGTNLFMGRINDPTK